MLEPGKAQIYVALPYMADNLRVFCGFFVDSRVFEKRKTILVIFGTLQFLTMGAMSFFEFEDAFHVVILLGINHFSLTFCDTTVETYIIQQARRDPKDGQQDLQAFRIFCFGLGSITGCITAAVGLQYYTP